MNRFIYFQEMMATTMIKVTATPKVINNEYIPLSGEASLPAVVVQSNIFFLK